jgi:hypothetical protein
MSLPPMTRASNADALAPLPAPGRKDRAPGPGAHAQAEAMCLRPAAVVRLKSTLTHWSSRCGGFVSGHAGHHRAQAAALNLADFNNCQPRTHPTARPYLHQAARKLHRVSGLTKVTRTSGGRSNPGHRGPAPGPARASGQAKLSEVSLGIDEDQPSAEALPSEFSERTVNSSPRLWIAQPSCVSAPPAPPAPVERPVFCATTQICTCTCCG